MRRGAPKQPEPIYLLRTKHNAERAVVRRLRVDLGLRAYSPQYLRRDRGGPVAVPLFACYVFAWPQTMFQQCSRVKGVVSFVHFGEQFPEVPQDVVDELRAMEGPTGYIQVAGFNRWARVRLRDGTGVGIVRRRDNLSNVVVLFNVLGRPIETSVPERDLVAA